MIKTDKKAANCSIDFIKKSLENAMSYQEYREFVSSLLSQGKSTSKEDSIDLVEYSKLNNSRMKRLDKTLKIPKELNLSTKNFTNKVTWLVITEGWCGDAAQNIPVINKLAETNKNIDLKLVLRDENTELMNAFLTNGNSAIPKLIQIIDNKVVNTWGPRPSFATKMVADYKEKNGSLDPEFKKDLQLWYNQDKGINTMEDLVKTLGV